MQNTTCRISLRSFEPTLVGFIALVSVLMLQHTTSARLSVDPARDRMPLHHPSPPPLLFHTPTSRPWSDADASTVAKIVTGEGEEDNGSDNPVERGASPQHTRGNLYRAPANASACPPYAECQSLFIGCLNGSPSLLQDNNVHRQLAQANNAHTKKHAVVDYEDDGHAPPSEFDTCFKQFVRCLDAQATRYVAHQQGTLPSDEESPNQSSPCLRWASTLHTALLSEEVALRQVLSNAEQSASSNANGKQPSQPGRSPTLLHSCEEEFRSIQAADNKSHRTQMTLQENTTAIDATAAMGALPASSVCPRAPALYGRLRLSGNWSHAFARPIDVRTLVLALANDLAVELSEVGILVFSLKHSEGVETDGQGNAGLYADFSVPAMDALAWAKFDQATREIPQGSPFTTAENTNQTGTWLRNTFGVFQQTNCSGNFSLLAFGSLGPQPELTPPSPNHHGFECRTLCFVTIAIGVIIFNAAFAVFVVIRSTRFPAGHEGEYVYLHGEPIDGEHDPAGDHNNSNDDNRSSDRSTMYTLSATSFFNVRHHNVSFFANQSDRSSIVSADTEPLHPHASPTRGSSNSSGHFTSAPPSFRRSDSISSTASTFVRSSTVMYTTDEGGFFGDEEDHQHRQEQQQVDDDGPEQAPEDTIDVSGPPDNEN